VKAGNTAQRSSKEKTPPRPAQAGRDRGGAFHFLGCILPTPNVTGSEEFLR